MPRASSDARAAGVRSADPVGKLTVRFTDGPDSGVWVSAGAWVAVCVTRGCDGADEVDTGRAGEGACGAEALPPSLMPRVEPDTRFPVGFRALIIESADCCALATPPVPVTANMARGMAAMGFRNPRMVDPPSAAGIVL